MPSAQSCMDVLAHNLGFPSNAATDNYDQRSSIDPDFTEGFSLANAKHAIEVMRIRGYNVQVVEDYDVVSAPKKFPFAVNKYTSMDEGFYARDDATAADDPRVEVTIGAEDRFVRIPTSAQQIMSDSPSITEAQFGPATRLARIPERRTPTSSTSQPVATFRPPHRRRKMEHPRKFFPADHW